MGVNCPTMPDQTGALKVLLSTLERPEIRHAIGGSLASSVRGVYRATIDVDMVADIRAAHADDLVSALGRDWYGDADTIRRSVSAGRSFNLIHIPTSGKYDIFPKVSGFHSVQLERATVEAFDYMGTAVESCVATAEDIALAKLRWYRDDGEVSERQWNDIVGVLAVQLTIDDAYLELWAEQLGVADLLDRARAAAK